MSWRSTAVSKRQQRRCGGGRCRGRQPRLSAEPLVPPHALWHALIASPGQHGGLTVLQRRPPALQAARRALGLPLATGAEAKALFAELSAAVANIQQHEPSAAAPAHP